MTATVDGLDPTLAAAAAAWLAEDPDPVTAAELRGLLAAATATGSAADPAGPSDRTGELAGEPTSDLDGEQTVGGSPDAARDAARAELADAFAGPLEFGTAGLRGRLGPGPNRMNRVVVARAAAGLAAHLRATGGHTVVIGYDARHNSAVFARDTADIAAGAGFRAILLPRALPTPLLAASVLALGASAGVMVTASHNPAPDNGYKVYLGDGRQIVAPTDTAIAARIEAVGPLRGLPRAPDDVEVPDVDGPGGLLTRYLARLQVLIGGDTSSGGGGTSGSSDGAAGPARPGVALVITALHGVGGPVLAAALAAAGFTGAAPVAAQEEPDPAFGGMPFPNPEESGVLDQAIAQAAATGADLVLACDPDADRCAVAVPDPRVGWRRLSGDELGSLLAWRVLTTELAPLAADDRARGAAPERGRDTRHGVPQGGGHPGPARTVLATTIVSSTQIDALAARAGAPVAHTLTGFKWLTRVPGLRFAYEEALGYCVDPATVADKDGISACLVMADLAARLKAGQLPTIGTSLTDVLDRIDADCGVVATAQLSIRVTRLARRDELLAALAADPPQRLGPLAVTRVDDLGAGVDGLPPTPGLRLTLRSAAPDRTADGRDQAAGRDGTGGRDGDSGREEDAGRDGGLTGRVVVRPSGTEAKLKCYLQVAPAPTADVEAARGTAAAALAAVRHDLAARLA